MRFSVTGLNHTTAPVAVRERLAFAQDRIPQVTGELRRLPGFREGLVLSTCNRVEIAITAEDASDTRGLVEEFLAAPRVAEVYNLGGGRDNSCSIMEAFARIAAITGKPMSWEYVDKAREGDHICYISDLTKLQQHYPKWGITKSLDDIFSEIASAWEVRAS